MLKTGEFIVKHRLLILLLGVLLIIPSVAGYLHTRVNYDILSYLPGDIDTMKGQEILKEEFGQGGFSFVVTEGMTDREIKDTAERIRDIDHVADVVCYQSLTDLGLPEEVLPAKLREVFSRGDASLMAVFFEDTTSADSTLAAVEEMRRVTSEKCFISGMSAVTDDMKHLSDSESVVYAVIAVILTGIVLVLTMDSFLIPLFFMLSIGLAIIWNLGTNFIGGEISFLTQSLALVLQLAFSPSAIRSVGFQLSYAAMLGIFLIHPWLSSFYPSAGKRPDPVRKIWEAASLSLSCQVTTAPIVWICFRSFPVYFLITNLIAIPLTTLLVGTSVALLLLSFAGICPDAAVRLTEGLADALLGALRVIASR